MPAASRQRENDLAGTRTLHAKLFLQRFNRTFVEIDKAGDAGKKYRQEEHHRHKLSARDLRENLRQHDEDQRRSALRIGAEGEYRR